MKPQPDENGLSFMPNAPLDWREDVHGEWHPWKGETPNGDTWRGRVQCWPGDKLWVRETWGNNPEGPGYVYRADGDFDMKFHWDRWRPSIHMPRRASRITLEVVSVRVERLQDISEEAAKAEGGAWTNTGLNEWGYQNNGWSHVGHKHAGGCLLTARHSFWSLWESINGPGSWDANPYVWVVEFRKLDQP